MEFVLEYPKAPMAASEQRLNLYVSAHYDTGGMRTREPVHKTGSRRHATHCTTEADILYSTYG